MSHVQKRKRLKENREWVVARYSCFPAVFFFVFGVISLFFWNDIGPWGAIVLGICGVPCLVYAVNYRISMDMSTFTVRNVLRVTKTYGFADVVSYRKNLHYTYLYLKDGKRIRIKIEDEVDDRLDKLLRRLKQNNVSPKRKTSSTRLYWGNCSRPVQLTLFLIALSLIAFITGALACVGIHTLTLEESDLEEIRFTVTQVEVTENVVYLYDTNEGMYDAAEALANGRNWFDLHGKHVRILTDGIGTICALTDSAGQRWFSYDEHYADNFGVTLLLILVMGVLFFGGVTMIVLAFVAYHDPDAHPRLYDSYETMNFWSRH